MSVNQITAWSMVGDFGKMMVNDWSASTNIPYAWTNNSRRLGLDFMFYTTQK